MHAVRVAFVVPSRSVVAWLTIVRTLPFRFIARPAVWLALMWLRRSGSVQRARVLKLPNMAKSRSVCLALMVLQWNGGTTKREPLIIYARAAASTQWLSMVRALCLINNYEKIMKSTSYANVILSVSVEDSYCDIDEFDDHEDNNYMWTSSLETMRKIESIESRFRSLELFYVGPRIKISSHSELSTYRITLQLISQRNNKQIVEKIINEIKEISSVRDLHIVKHD